MMLAARLLCSGERPESLQRLFQTACRFRLCAKGRTCLLALPFISRDLPGAHPCQDDTSQAVLGNIAQQIIDCAQTHE